MPKRDLFYTTRAWKQLRLRILARDHYRCQIGLPGCTEHATHVDHVVPRSVDPDRAMDPDNLRAACPACNLQLGGRLGAGAARRARAMRSPVSDPGYSDW